MELLSKRIRFISVQSGVCCASQSRRHAPVARLRDDEKTHSSCRWTNYNNTAARVYTRTSLTFPHQCAKPATLPLLYWFKLPHTSLHLPRGWIGNKIKISRARVDRSQRTHLFAVSHLLTKY